MKNNAKKQIELIRKELRKKTYDQYFQEHVEKDIYASDELENYIDNDLISSAEEGFMVGYLAA